MVLNFVNKTKIPIPKNFLEKWTKAIQKTLKPKDLRGLKLDREMTIMFVSPPLIRSLNRKFRDKDEVTDILSFGSFEPNDMPELIICPQVLKKQAKEHGLSFNFELGYLTLHGVLHLLHYDHEHGGRKAKQMYDLQDKIYAKISKHLS